MIAPRLLAAAGAALALAGCSDPCGNTVIARAASPDGRREAVVFERNCGATTGSSLQVSVVDPGEIPADAGNAFRSDGDVGDAGAEARSGPAVEAEWLPSGELVVRYPPWLRIFAQEAEAHGAGITYEPAD